MTKARSFSIYLLKDQYAEPAKALKSDHELSEASYGDGAAQAWPTFLASREMNPPWWREYFGITDPVKQGFAGAIVFVKASGRTFALTFGQTHHNLRDEAYEYDFGLRTTLNAVEPTEIRNTDELDPSTSRRRRTQLPEHADLTYFDFDGDSTVLRSLTGAIRPEYKALFSYATGASNLRVSTKKQSSELPGLLEKIYEVYQKTTYLDAFPAAQNIQPVKDPVDLGRLDDTLLEAVHSRSDALLLTIPELVNFQQDFEIFYSGEGKSDLYLDASAENYFEYLTENGKDPADLSVDDLQRRQKLHLIDDAGVSRAKYSIYRCMVFETTLEGEAGTYHLSEGTWYQVADDYLQALTAYLDPLFTTPGLPARTEHLESEYNRLQLVPHWPGSLLLDATDTSPGGETAVEPCDVARVEDGHLVLTHVKLGVKSVNLSHLFNQGANSVELLNGTPEAATILEGLITEREPTFNVAPLAAQRFRVEYVIVTKKDPALASGALPLFSRISLRRAHKALKSMRVEATVALVEDAFEATSRPKPRKKKTAKKAAAKKTTATSAASAS